MFHRHPRAELTPDGTGSRLNTPFFFYSRGAQPGVKRLWEKHGVNTATTSYATRVASWRGSLLEGSLPRRTERLVLTCRTHTPEWSTHDMREMVKPGVIKHLHTLHHHLTMHAKLKLSVVSLPPWSAQKTSRGQDSYQHFHIREFIFF